MSQLDHKLTARVSALRSEIAGTEKAPPPVDEVVSAALAELDRAVAAFKVAPFKAPALHEQAPAWPLIERSLAGAFGALMPKETRAMVERATRERCDSFKGQRLSAADKARRLIALRGELRQAEAHVERARRKIEAEEGDAMSRGPADDPGVWLSVDTDLELIAGGKEPIAEEGTDDATAANHGTDAGCI